MPNGIPEPSDAAITTANELRFNDWQECRTTIGRLDTILVDLRKLGFSFITGLLTAGAFLNFLGVQTTKEVSAPSPDLRAAIFIAIMVLVAALFSIDTYYQVLLSGAVERALDLEEVTDPRIRITRYMSNNATDSMISYLILFMYLALLATAEGLGLLATGRLELLAKGLDLTLWPIGTRFWASLLVGVGVVASGLIYELWRRGFPGEDG